MKRFWLFTVLAAVVLALAAGSWPGAVAGARDPGVTAAAEALRPAIASGWTLNEIDTCEAQIMARSVAIDEQGNPHVVYACNRTLRHARWTGTYWLYRTVNLDLDIRGQALDFALDADGNAHIAFVEAPAGKLTGPVHYMYLTGLTWRDEIADPGFEAAGTFGCEVSIALDAGDHPHLAYGSESELRYAGYDGTTWDIQTVTDNIQTSLCVAMDVTPAGAPHIAYHDMGFSYGGELRYAVPGDPDWDISVVDAYPDMTGITFGRPGSLELDPAGTPHIVYDDAPGDSLRYAVLKNGTWSKSTITGADPVERGYRGTLAVDAAGIPHVAYAYAGGASLVYARQTAGGWASEVIDTPGLAAAIAVGADVYIAHLPTVPGPATLAIGEYDASNRVYLPLAMVGQ